LKDVVIKTSINLNGMDKLKMLLGKQQEILSELDKNITEIETTARDINIELSLEKATH
jgi:hypothetical protein